MDSSGPNSPSTVSISIETEPALKHIEQRISEWILAPAEYGEDFIFSKYSVGQELSPRVDYFPSDTPKEITEGK